MRQQLVRAILAAAASAMALSDDECTKVLEGGLEVRAIAKDGALFVEAWSDAGETFMFGSIAEGDRVTMDAEYAGDGWKEDITKFMQNEA